MDDTTQSRASDVASAATRKRRSSILKSQRPPRTPFCELEFNVTTPTETGKSRRVSFSRRTGVAEFVTNEATTTWKNFYEEHNKSLESSGNDSAVNHFKQPIAHLGKRIFDQQFEEVEAVDFMSHPGMSGSSSINNIHFALDSTESKLTAPQSNFELSAFTEAQSKLFGDDLAITCAGEVTDRIDINFSAIQQIGEKDDLDEIQEDLQRQSNIVCQGPFGRQNISEYIEVDLDVTHAVIVNDESDMSITDTIHSPKVQEVTKSGSIDKKVSLSGNDWVVDKENLPVNPYVAPRESLNFAVHEEPDKVLVFDGKKLIVETEKPKIHNYPQNLPNPSDCVPQRKTIVLNCNDDLPNFLEESQASKNASYFVSDFKQNMVVEDKFSRYHLNKSQNKEKTIIYDDFNDISVTQAIHNVVPDAEKRRTIVYDDKIGNISITQALPTNIIDKEKRRTIVYDNDNANISITQAVPNLLIPSENNKKRSTIVFENEECNISLTQAIPANIIKTDNSALRHSVLLKDGTSNVCITQPVLKPKDSTESRRAVVYDENNGNISVTQSVAPSISSNADAGRRTTVVFESDVSNISVTQALSSKIIIPVKLNTTTYDYDSNISMTQAVPVNILLANPEPSRRRTVVFEDGNLSITQAVPKNQVLHDFIQQQKQVESGNIEAATYKALHSNNVSSDVGRTVMESEDNNMSITQAVCINQVQSKQNNSKRILEDATATGNKRRTIVFQNDAADMSITQAIPIRQFGDNIQVQRKKELDESIEATNVALHNQSNNKRRTVVFDNDDADISMTQAVPINQVLEAIRKENKDIENTNVSKNKDVSTNNTRVFVSENDVNDISLTQAVPFNQVIEATNLALHKEDTNKRRTIVFEKEDGDISVTQAVPINQVINIMRDVKENDNENPDATFAALHGGLPNKRRTVVFEKENANISITQTVPMNQLIDNIQKDIQKEILVETTNVALHEERSSNRRRTIVYENDETNVSMTETVPANQVIDVIKKEELNTEATGVTFQKEEHLTKRKTVVFDKKDANISMTRAVPMNQDFDIIEKQNNITVTADKRRTVVFDTGNDDISLTQAISVKYLFDGTQKQNKIMEQTNMTINDKEVRNERRTVVYRNEDANILMTQAVIANQVLPGRLDRSNHNIAQDETNNIMCKALVSHNTTNRKQDILYDDDEGDISMTRAVSSSIILPNGEEKKRTIVVESVDSLLENEDLFMDVDRNTDDDGIDIKNKEYDVSMTDLSDIEITDRRAITYESDINMCITKVILESFSPKKGSCQMNLNEKTVTTSKPIPAELAAFQTESLQKSLCKNMSRFDESQPDVLVYQSITANIQNITAKTDKGSEETEDKFTYKKDESHKKEKRSKSNKEKPESELSTVPHIELPKSKMKSTILNDLLDMSQSSYDELTENKEIVFKTSSDHTPTNTDQADNKESENNMFYITKDSDEDGQIGKSAASIDTLSYTKEIDDGQTDKSKILVGSLSYTKELAIEDKEPLSIEYKDDDDPLLVRDTLQQLSGIKNVLREDHAHYESQRKIEYEHDRKDSLDVSKRKSGKFKTANDTNELLDMISNFTDKRVSRIPALEEMRESEEDLEPELVSIKERLSLESKLESNPQPQLNRALKRQSVVLSREDLLNNLSMASAMLQKSLPDYDETESIDESMETPDVSQHKKSVRMSTEVVKQLKFEDDSISERSESNQTPLKKITFGEISSTKEPKSKVIPDYEVSDGIKELMDDLVKPTNEVVPFTTTNLDKSLKNKPSVNSAQIQANLLNSSQIDLQTELYSTTNSTYEMNKISSTDIISDAVNRSVMRALKSPEKSVDLNVPSDEAEGKTEEDTPQTKNYFTNGTVLIFDQTNPLNNVLLAAPAPHAIDIHRYNPIKPMSESNEVQSGGTDEDKKKLDDRVTNQYHVEFKVSKFENQDKLDEQSIASNISKPMSIDQATEPEHNKVKDVEINTVIAMKGNRQLLEATSSLTLVDDALESKMDLKLDSKLKPCKNPISPVTVIYQVEESSQKVDSDLTSTDELEKPKSKKRIYSPAKSKHKNCTLSSLDVTSKPIAKVLKRSSPVREPNTIDLDKSPEHIKQKSSVRQKSPRKLKNKKPGTSVTVQQLTTMIHMDRDKDRDSSTTDPRSVCASDILALVTSSEMISSFNSSNNLRDDSSLGQSQAVSINPSKAEWVPESTSSFMVHGCDSVDIVAMIDAMPYMGSHDCQWESVGGSVWTLLLLHCRLRLTIRFAETPRVRPDTPVLNTELETLHQDKKNPIAYLCVLFAAEMMRHYMSRGCSAAIDVKKLVRRLAGAARLAAQWARAMHDARARLAYSLSPDGWLALKVANTSYRTVWEVSMRLELVMEDARAAPWPRACGVRVARALPAAGAPPPDLARVLAATPRDWGHVPRTIWKVFRYLKHKKRDDSELHL